jgi:hypothetical protein
MLQCCDVVLNFQIWFCFLFLCIVLNRRSLRVAASVYYLLIIQGIRMQLCFEASTKQIISLDRNTTWATTFDSCTTIITTTIAFNLYALLLL